MLLAVIYFSPSLSSLLADIRAGWWCDAAPSRALPLVGRQGVTPSPPSPGDLGQEQVLQEGFEVVGASLAGAIWVDEAL